MYLPKPTKHGGSPVGNSYLSLFTKCPRKWFYTFYYPQPGGEQDTLRGLSPRFTAEPLLLGGEFHEGIAAWYGSGCKDGEDTGQYSLEAGIETARLYHDMRKAEYESPEKADECWAKCQFMLERYHGAYGPGGACPDWPDIKIVHDEDGQPMIERDFTIPIYPGYVYTCRVDAIVERYGFLQIMEHKTSAPSSAWQRVKTIHMDSQFTGEILCLRHEFPDTAQNGALVNVVRNRATLLNDRVAVRETTDRNVVQLTRFKQKVHDVLRRIDDAVAGYTHDMEKGDNDPDTIVSRWFPDYGSNNSECFSYMRDCDFTMFCQAAQPEEVSLRHFKPKGKEEKMTLVEHGG
jgi:hypothetical protein